MSGVVERALDEVCAIFGATDALLVWEEAEEPWVIVGTRLVRAAAESDDPAGAVGALVVELAAGLAQAS